MAARPVVESKDTQWLTTSASLAVGASFFALWFWLLPSWLGFDVAAVGAARWGWVGGGPAGLGFLVAPRCVLGFGRAGGGAHGRVVPPPLDAVGGVCQCGLNTG